MSHFPDVDRMEAVLRVWPRLFASKPVGLAPLRLEDETLVVLCQAVHLVDYVAEHRDVLAEALNAALGREVVVRRVEPVLATSVEMYLADELMALKLWLRDFDAGL